MPSARWFRGDFAFGNEFLAPESVAGGGDGDAFFHGVKVRLLFEFLAEFLAPGFQQFHVGFTVRFHFSSQNEAVVSIDLLGVPPFKFRFLLGGHAIRIARVSGRHDSIIVLIL